MDTKMLLEEASKAQLTSYAPYSGFHVGAALLSKTGTVFRGGNIENASYGLSMCAERVALFKAVSEGAREFEALALVCDGEEFCYPCGACRQVLSEFAPQMTVIITNGAGEIRATTVEDLLPGTFKLAARGSGAHDLKAGDKAQSGGVSHE